MPADGTPIGLLLVLTYSTPVAADNIGDHTLILTFDAHTLIRTYDKHTLIETVDAHTLIKTN